MYDVMSFAREVSGTGEVGWDKNFRNRAQKGTRAHVLNLCRSNASTCKAETSKSATKIFPRIIILPHTLLSSQYTNIKIQTFTYKDKDTKIKIQRFTYKHYHTKDRHREYMKVHDAGRCRLKEAP